jgi:hypothetical protein
MPWQPDDATKFNKGIQSSRQRAVWAGIANETLAKTGDEGRAIRAANSAFKARHEAERGTNS